MKFLRLSVKFFSLLSSLRLCFYTLLMLMNLISLCFMITAKVVDFSKSLCVVKQTASPESSADSKGSNGEDNKRSVTDPEELRHEALQRQRRY